MSAVKVTDQQIGIYMNEREDGKTQKQAAAKASLSERSGRRIDKGELKGGMPRERNWRTRKDPLESLWQEVILPLLTSTPDLSPITIHEHLNEHHSEAYDAKHQRTLQRRIKQWCLQYGPEKEVMFRQEKVPGEMGLSDFTELKDFSINIQHKVFPHRLYHYRLAFSGWCFVKVIHGGESFAALSAGLQDAFWRCGGVPRQHRTDSLSAAYKNRGEQDKFTANYESLCRHYGFQPTRNTRGKSHENGAIESPHGHLKRKMRQALLLRGNNNFNDLEEYESFIHKIVAKINASHKTRIEEERPHLAPLPKHRTHDYSEVQVSVTSSSTISVKRVLYSVPSRLIGSHLKVRLYDHKLVLYAGHEVVAELTRIYAIASLRSRKIDYRHVIGSLAKKPQAFRHSNIRDDLLPNADYRAIWQYVDKHFESKKACKYIVRLLQLAASEDCEGRLGRFACQCLAKQQLPSIDSCKKHFSSLPSDYAITETHQHSLKDYDLCINSTSQEVNHG